MKRFEIEYAKDSALWRSKFPTGHQSSDTADLEKNGILVPHHHNKPLDCVSLMRHSVGFYDIYFSCFMPNGQETLIRKTNQKKI
jgi:hypothetical protein